MYLYGFLFPLQIVCVSQKVCLTKRQINMYGYTITGNETYNCITVPSKNSEVWLKHRKENGVVDRLPFP